MRAWPAPRAWRAAPALLRLAVLLPFLALAQEGCGELELLVKQLQQENAELIQQAAGHEAAKLDALRAAEGLQQQAGALEAAKGEAERKAGALEAAKSEAERKAAASEAAKTQADAANKEALESLEHLKLQIGGHEAAKVEALQAVEALKQQAQATAAGHEQAQAALRQSVQEMKRRAAEHEERANHLTATCQNSEEMPYLSSDIFYKVFNILADVTSVGVDGLKETYPDFDKQLTEVAWTVTNISMEQVQTLSAQASELSAQLASQAYDAADKAKAATLELHRTHVEPHLGAHLAEAQKQGMDLYASHVEPHLGTARSMYAESVHPHVDTAGAVLREALAVAGAQARAALAVASDLRSGGLITTLSSTLSAYVSDAHLKMLQEMELLAPRAIQVGHRVLKFPRGMLDIVAALVQLALVGFVAFVVAWRLFLKTLLWRLGVKVFGIRVLGAASRCLRLCRAAVGLAVGLTLRLMSWALGLVNMVTCFGLMSAISAAFVYGTELSLLLGLGVSKGLSLPLRLGIGLALGLVWSLAVGWGTLCACCGLCRRRQKKSVEAKPAKKAEANGVAKAKPEAKANGEKKPASGKKK